MPHTDTVESINEVPIILEESDWFEFEGNILWVGFGNVMLVVLEHFYK
jgi:hypothetical protein